MAATLLASVPLLPALAQETASLLDDTRKTALPLLPQVVGTMQKAVKEGGVVGAIPVCKERRRRCCSRCASGRAGRSSGSA